MSFFQNFLKTQAKHVHGDLERRSRNYKIGKINPVITNRDAILSSSCCLCAIPVTPKVKIASTFCLFIGVLGRSDYYGHYAPITHVKNLSRRVYHRELNIENVGENGTCLYPG